MTTILFNGTWIIEFRCVGLKEHQNIQFYNRTQSDPILVPSESQTEGKPPTFPLRQKTVKGHKSSKNERDRVLGRR